MKLHEAIVKLLQERGRAMTTEEIADALNRNGWYTKRDGSTISAFQIHGRTRNYSHLFIRNGSLVSLKNDGKRSAVPVKHDPVWPKPQRLTKKDEMSEELVLKVLMNEKNFKSTGTIDLLVPDRPGLYCIRIDKAEGLSEPFRSYLYERQHNILYIGIATQSLRQRFLNQELRAIGHGTFFRGIGAVLGFRPPKGSLVDKKNKNNYKFSYEDEQKIINWINRRLLVNWVEYNGDFEKTETALITKYLPLLNTDKNPAKLSDLAALRKECREIANQAF